MKNKFFAYAMMVTVLSSGVSWTKFISTTSSNNSSGSNWSSRSGSGSSWGSGGGGGGHK
jgi:hypothetical protein